MEIQIRKAMPEDVESIVNNRIDFLYELTGKQQSDEFRTSTQEYLHNHISDGTTLCFIATHKECIVSSVILCLYNVIPKLSNISGKTGYVFNVYTIREFQGQGLATKLMNEMIAEAKQLGIGELYLSATEEGRRVYEKLKFQNMDREMSLKLI